MSRDLIERLRAHPDEAVRHWEDWAQEADTLMREAADRIAALEAEASEDARLLGQAGEKIANLSGEIDRLKRDLARVEAEALERAAKVANSDADERIGSLQADAGRRIRDAIRALTPEAPAREGNPEDDPRYEPRRVCRRLIGLSPTRRSAWPQAWRSMQPQLRRAGCFRSVRGDVAR